MQSEIKAAEKLLTAYCNAVTLSDPETLAALYSDKGKFLPEGSRSIAGRDAIKRSAELFFKQRQVILTYTIEAITIEGEFAFVEARSKCTVRQVANGKENSFICKDSFVLRKEQQDWKVFRYMFNS